MQGCLYTVTMDSRTGALSRTHRHRSKAKHPSPITTVQYRTFSLLARGPVLLTFSRDGSLSFFRLSWTNKYVFKYRLYVYESRLFYATDGISYCSVSLEVQGYLTIRCALKLTPRLHSIRASFCPLLSLEKGEYIGMYACQSHLLRGNLGLVSEVDLLLLIQLLGVRTRMSTSTT